MRRRIASMTRMESFMVIMLPLFAPAVLVFLGWVYWGTAKVGAGQQWRRTSLCVALIVASAAWLLLAALELSMPYLRKVYGQPFVETFWRRSFPIGLLLSVSAVPLALLGRGRGRFFCACGAIGLCWWWYFLALLE
jgi:hypothetical protein